MSVERSPKSIMTGLRKRADLLAAADPHSGPFKSLYESLPEKDRDAWFAAVKEIAATSLLRRERYNRMIVEAAIRHGLVPANTRRLPRATFFKLKDNATAAKQIANALIFSPGKVRALGSQITQLEARKHRRIK